MNTRNYEYTEGNTNRKSVESLRKVWTKRLRNILSVGDDSTNAKCTCVVHLVVDKNHKGFGSRHQPKKAEKGALITRRQHLRVVFMTSMLVRVLNSRTGDEYTLAVKYFLSAFSTLT